MIRVGEARRDRYDVALHQKNAKVARRWAQDNLLLPSFLEASNAALLLRQHFRLRFPCRLLLSRRS
jgi:hypothetical protein